MSEININECWARKINNKLTFAGVIDEHYNDVAERWKEPSTRRNNNADYNNRILPALKDHNLKSIDQYVKEDFDQAIEMIKEDFERQNGVPYQDSTIQHYRHLIYVVIAAAVKNRICNEILWGSTFRLPDHLDFDQLIDEQINEYVRLKKSFTPEEETKIVQELFIDPLQRGQDMGLLLMSAFGLRNAESCAANYGDIKEMRLHPQNHALWVYTTTEADTNRIKASGKSKNADRVIPVYDKLFDFIMARRTHLENLFSSGQLQFPSDGNIQSIDDLPIANVGDDYFTRCSTPDLTAAARELFHKVNLNEKQLAYIEASLSDPFLTLKEKEATAYLFRRHFGTMLHILGFEVPEIHYTIGHEIEDDYETRNEFVNEERLLLIKKKMEQRPFFGTCLTMATNQEEHMSMSSTHDRGVHFRVPATQGVLYTNLKTVEPTDAIKIQIRCKGKKRVRTIKRHTTSSYSRTINILEAVHKRYQ